ncbi:MAG: cytochrome c [Acidimicrobiia bacterium]
MDNEQQEKADAPGAFSRGYSVLFGVFGGLFVTAVLAVTVLVAFPIPQDPVSGQGALSVEAAAGRETFRTVGCSACHGDNGQGGVGPAMPGHTEEQVFRQVRTPIGDVMPPFPVTILSDDDVRNISAWIATLGDEMVMVHAEEAEGGHDEPEMSSTQIAHLRLLLTSVEAENTDDALRHVQHLARHGAEPELLDLAAAIEADLVAGRPHDAEQKALEALGPAADEEFDVIAAHLGMALSANQRGEELDVGFHISTAAEASVGHDHEALLKKLLDDWRSGIDRHAVIDALYEALKLEHPTQ